MLFPRWILIDAFDDVQRLLSPMSARVELLISALSWLTAIGLIVGIIADALR